jgi:hypothetical protein
MEEGNKRGHGTKRRSWSWTLREQNADVSAFDTWYIKLPLSLEGTVCRNGRQVPVNRTFITVLQTYRNRNQICALLEYYETPCGNSLPTFRDNVSVLSLRAS